MIVFPTQVGVIPNSDVNKFKKNRVPHTGGGDPNKVTTTGNPTWCSPHRWG